MTSSQPIRELPIVTLHSLLGIVGNTLSLLVMIRPNNKKISTCIYMAAISINDNVMMCIILFSWLFDFGLVEKLRVWECYFFVYIQLSLLQLGTYLVLAMTIDKYVAIKWPHRAAIFSTPRRSKIIIFTIIASGATYNLPHFFVTKLITGNCYAYSAKGVFTKVYS